MCSTMRIWLKSAPVRSVMFIAAERTLRTLISVGNCPGRSLRSIHQPGLSDGTNSTERWKRRS